MAELVEGVVYITESVNHVYHGRPHAHLCGLLGIYNMNSSHLDVGNNSTLRLDTKNELQPDVLLRLTTKAGGSSIIDEDGYIQGPPELIAEVAHNSASYDMHDKLKAYRRNGVQEYIIWLSEDERLLWYTLDDEEYRLLEADNDETIRSLIFPGLWLNVPAILTGDLRKAQATVQAGIQSPEHQRFVSKLKKTQEE